MKRSEVIEDISNYLESYMNVDNGFEFAEAILTIVEKKGMTPPEFMSFYMVEGEPKGVITGRYWETE